ncbi:hypothetical protein TH25_20575 [Thalassospira profundimaris]|uniref:Uncharacterized protein n=1 Tax=Thalassospira profundimaris TaxID=502049 RepID=A0A367WR42_9PROT|nr:hypothetical protein [Thalassospira profundimaris]RCK43848.1 hypothetical protein TH25_20575 [Thalassospira profundimaris]
MEDFQEGFRLMGLSTGTPKEYKGAEEFAKKFEKCSMLNNHSVVHSSHSNAVPFGHKTQINKEKYYEY